MSAAKKPRRHLHAHRASLRFTGRLVDRSKRLRVASEEVAAKGIKAGAYAAGVVGVFGCMQFLIGKPLWGMGSFVIAAATFLSHRIVRARMNSKLRDVPGHNDG